MESDKYFKIVSEFGNVIHIKPQGNWTDEIAEKFGKELKDKFKHAVTDMEQRSRKFIVLANMSNFKISGQKTKDLLTELMKTSVSNPMFYHTVQVIPDAITRISIQESSEKAGQTKVKTIVASLEEANTKIIDLKKELIHQ